MSGQIINNLILLAIVVAQAWLIREQRISKTDIARIEKNTNSLTAALVQSTRIEAHAAGVLEEKDRVK